MTRKVHTILVAAALAGGVWLHAETQAAESQTVEPSASTPRGKRDPFVSPVARTRGASAAPACPTGKRCLVVGQVTLKGVVRSENGMIAVVESPARRVYFLREAEPVMDGVVVRITADSIIFRENVMDGQGRVTTREVVKRIA